MGPGYWCSSPQCNCRATYHRCPNGCTRFYCMTCEDIVLGKREHDKDLYRFQPAEECREGTCCVEEVPESPVYDPEAVYDGPEVPVSPSYSW